MNFLTLLEDHSTFLLSYNEWTSNDIEGYFYESGRHHHDRTALNDICEGPDYLSIEPELALSRLRCIQVYLRKISQAG